MKKKKNVKKLLKKTNIVIIFIKCVKIYISLKIILNFKLMIKLMIKF